MLHPPHGLLCGATVAATLAGRRVAGELVAYRPGRWALLRLPSPGEGVPSPGYARVSWADIRPLPAAVARPDRPLREAA